MIIQFTFLTLLLSLVASDCNTPIIVGTIAVNDGAGPTYIAQGGGTKSGGISVKGDALTVNHNEGAFLASTCSDSFAPDTFKQLYLLDKTLSFTVDLANVGCACNAAFYLVNMPAYSQDGQADPTKCGDYYCDANNVCGAWCPEMDIFEANNRAVQVTPHKCDAKQGKWYPHCDGGGCGINTYRNNPNALGYGSNFMINTQLPFNIAVSFITSNGELARINTMISQNGKQFGFSHDDGRCGGGYLSSLTDAFKTGMVVVFSYWGDSGSSMSWLDVPPCDASQNCDDNTFVTFSNIQIN